MSHCLGETAPDRHISSAEKRAGGSKKKRLGAIAPRHF
jgi:hypothetical protein